MYIAIHTYIQIHIQYLFEAYNIIILYQLEYKLAVTILNFTSDLDLESSTSTFQQYRLYTQLCLVRFKRSDHAFCVSSRSVSNSSYGMAKFIKEEHTI